jgi:uncharacterized protein YgbK (DUF1537 family)
VTGQVAIGRESGPAAVLAGSCSVATRGQVAHMQARWPALRVDPLRLADDRQRVKDIVSWATTRMEQGPVLIYASAAPEDVAAVQRRLGSRRAGALVEAALAQVAVELCRAGLKKLIVAGGETSGAVLRALDIRALRIGPEIEPGVPWTRSAQPVGLVLALKSGNFGSPNFFTRALEMLA